MLITEQRVEEEWTQLNPEGIQALCQGAEHQARGTTGAKAIRFSVAGVPKYYCDLSQVRYEGLPKLSDKDLRKDQIDDPFCSLTLKPLEGQLPDLLLIDSPKEAQLVHKEWD